MPSVANFTPVASLAGGILIGLAAGAMLLFDGKLAGISGIAAGVLRPVKGDMLWRGCFLGGLIAGGAILRVADPHVFAFTISRSLGAVAVAGLLVGFGTRLGNGCTSGHGICGISRLSTRSLVATACFIATGAVTVFVVNHLLGGSL
ncbi:MAG: YeeE/YedE family protein [Candidatus Binataceae bacterium]